MNTRKDLAVHEWGLLDLKPLLMKSTLAAFGDTGAAPGSSTKASLQKKKGDEGTIGGFFFFSFRCLSFASLSMQLGIEEMLESQSG